MWESFLFLRMIYSEHLCNSSSKQYFVCHIAALRARANRRCESTVIVLYLSWKSAKSGFGLITRRSWIALATRNSIFGPERSFQNQLQRTRLDEMPDFTAAKNDLSVRSRVQISAPRLLSKKDSQPEGVFLFTGSFSAGFTYPCGWHISIKVGRIGLSSG
jgi:hypothetical protein